jgi:hypothetical protein
MSDSRSSWRKDGREINCERIAPGLFPILSREEAEKAKSDRYKCLTIQRLACLAANFGRKFVIDFQPKLTLEYRVSD